MDIEVFPKSFLLSYEKSPDQDCIVLSDERASYRELYERSLQVAKALSALGITKGERVGILMANSVDFVASLVGASFIGAVPMLYNGRFKSREIAHVTLDASIKVILTSDRIEEHVNYGDLLRSAIPELDHQSDLQKLEISEMPELQTAVMFGATQHKGFVSENDFLSLGMQLETYAILDQIDRFLLYKSPSPRDRG